MPIANKLASVVATMSCLGMTVLAVHTAVASGPVGGVTLAPATITLTLQKGDTKQTATFDVTNQYQTPVTLHFAFDLPVTETTGRSPAGWLSISQPELTLGPKETAHQIVTLQDSKDLPPGSQRSDLVVATVGAPGNGVSVSSSIRMPVIVVKEDGAVTALAFAGFSLGVLHITTPQSMHTMIHNDGNVIAIPRGTITVTSPAGTVVRRGVLNTASQAVSPGDTQTLGADLHKVGSVLLPGMYHVNLDYGLGGGQASKHASQSYFYIAWWHMVVLALLGTFLYFSKKYVANYGPRKKASARRHLSLARMRV